MTEYPYFRIIPAFDPGSRQTGYIIALVHNAKSITYLDGTFYPNTFSAKQQIDQWEWERKTSEEFLKQPPIDYNPKYIN